MVGGGSQHLMATMGGVSAGPFSWAMQAKAVALI